MNKFLDKVKKAMFTEEDDDTEQIDKIDDQLEDIIEKNSNIEMIVDSREEDNKSNGFITLDRKEPETIAEEEVIQPIVNPKPIEQPKPYFYKKESTAIKANEYKPTRIISPVYGVLQPNSEPVKENVEKKIVYSTDAIVSPIYGKGVINQEQPKSYFEKVNEELPKETEYDNVFTQPETVQPKPTEPIKEIIPDKFKQPVVSVNVQQVKKEESSKEESEKEYKNLSIFDF